jgi:hypothetical protein
MVEGPCRLIANTMSNECFCWLLRIEDASEIEAIEANARISQIRKGRHSLTRCIRHSIQYMFYHFENITKDKIFHKITTLFIDLSMESILFRGVFKRHILSHLGLHYINLYLSRRKSEKRKNAEEGFNKRSLA